MGWKSCLASYIWFIPADKSSRETERGPGGNKWRARQISRGKGEKVSERVLIVKWDGEGESVREKRQDIRWCYYVLSAKQQQKGHHWLFQRPGDEEATVPLTTSDHLSSTNTHTHTRTHTHTHTHTVFPIFFFCSSSDFFIFIIHKSTQTLFLIPPIHNTAEQRPSVETYVYLRITY